MRLIAPVVLMMLVAGVAPAQEPDRAVSLVRARLSEAAALEVVALVEQAQASGLSGRAVADLALQGAAQGRDGGEIVSAARRLVELLAAGRAALEASGRAPAPEEVAAAAGALQHGADPASVRAVAAGAPAEGRLGIALAVLGGLAASGVPVDLAASMVTSHLAQGGDAALAALGEQVAREGGVAVAGRRPDRPAGTGTVIHGLPFGGLTLPVMVPVGLPINIGVPGDRPVPPISPPLNPPGGRED